MLSYNFMESDTKIYVSIVFFDRSHHACSSSRCVLLSYTATYPAQATAPGRFRRARTATGAPNLPSTNHNQVLLGAAVLRHRC